ncbi:hypothetical protein H3C61_01580 [Candidatus Gracilibacteria bacterium]|nr:hypothetical protein [Candidatus Gracilibacteria bacterium]
MKSKIELLLSEIKQKKEDLYIEYSKLKEKYGYVIEQGKVKFKEEIKKKNKFYKISIFESIFSARVREVLSAPFIYAMIVPAIILDIFLFIFQQTAIRLYKIPLVKRSDYIIFDRKQLDYLNLIQKVNCLYCSYVNGLFSYAVEIAGRTEKYWCPIKNASKKKGGHDWEEYFADYGDPETFMKIMGSIEEFKKNKKI